MSHSGNIDTTSGQKDLFVPPDSDIRGSLALVVVVVVVVAAVVFVVVASSTQ